MPHIVGSGPVITLPQAGTTGLGIKHPRLGPCPKKSAPLSGTMVSMSIMSPGGSEGPRLSDADRDRVVEVLKRSCGDGRLTLDDFSERVGAAYQAVSLGDIPPLLGDIPHPFGPDLAGVLGARLTICRCR